MDFGSSGSGFPAPYNNGSTDYFIAKWEGRFYAPVAGEYTFRLRSDDGSALVINGQMVVANGSLQSYAGSDEIGSVALAVGHHDFLLAYSEYAGGQGLTLDMSYPGGTLAPMPTSLLSGGGEAVITSISSATGALLEIQNGAALALDLGVNTTFDGRIDAGVSDGAVLIKRGAGTLSLDPNGHAIDGMTSVEGGTLAITSDGGDTFGPMQIGSGTELAVNVAVGRSGVAPVSGMGLLGYYYDYGVGETTAFETALNSGNLNTVETFLAGQTIDLIENSTTSADVFCFGLGYNGIGAFPRAMKIPTISPLSGTDRSLFLRAEVINSRRTATTDRCSISTVLWWSIIPDGMASSGVKGRSVLRPVRMTSS
jgi:autotransporter-associated beta strand protein